jgi:hypothetical protein
MEKRSASSDCGNGHSDSFSTFRCAPFEPARDGPHVLACDARGPGRPVLTAPQTFLREIAVNLSFSILVALALVATALTALFGPGDNNQDLKIGRLPTFLLITGASALMLSLLMVLRRMYVLILNEFDGHKLR